MKSEIVNHILYDPVSRKCSQWGELVEDGNQIGDLVLFFKTGKTGK